MQMVTVTVAFSILLVVEIESLPKSLMSKGLYNSPAPNFGAGGLPS